MILDLDLDLLKSRLVRLPHMTWATFVSILGFLLLVMVALCNRADHYIFMLWFVLLLLLLLVVVLFPRLISAVGDWMFTILWHMVWP